jgi:hypothetical protein
MIFKREERWVVTIQMMADEDTRCTMTPINHGLVLPESKIVPQLNDLLGTILSLRNSPKDILVPEDMTHERIVDALAGWAKVLAKEVRDLP